MRESKARKRILEAAEAMFNEVGYSSLNVNDVAHRANVSIGTLYYHFPSGKQSILMEIRRRTAEYHEVRFAEKLNERQMIEAKSFDDGLGLLLKTLIDLHREQRLILAAAEVEVLSNLTTYSSLAESVDARGIAESDAEPVTRVLRTLLGRHHGEGLTLTGREATLHRILDALIHRFVYFEPVFGSESEFVEALTKIVRAFLK